RRQAERGDAGEDRTAAGGGAHASLRDQEGWPPAGASATGEVSENSPVLSPKLSTSSMPSVCISDSIAFAMGVPSAAFRCIPPWRPAFLPPTRKSGHLRWLCRLPSAIGEPYMMSVLSSRLESPSAVFFSFSRKYGS